MFPNLSRIVAMILPHPLGGSKKRKKLPPTRRWDVIKTTGRRSPFTIFMHLDFTYVVGGAFLLHMKCGYPQIRVHFRGRPVKGTKSKDFAFMIISRRTYQPISTYACTLNFSDGEDMCISKVYLCV